MKSFCLTIAGSDPTSGAGIQADIRTMDRVGVHPFSAITAITFQSATQFHGFKSLSGELAKQLDSILKVYPVEYVKIGMIPDIQSLKVIVSYIQQYDLFVVYDPVTVSSAGKRLSDEGLEGEIESKLFPHIKVLTPNIHETLYYTNNTLEEIDITSDEDIKELALNLLNKMDLSEDKDKDKAIVIKSVEFSEEEISDVLIYRNQGKIIFRRFKKNKIHVTGNVHGTGCVFSSALAAFLSKGLDIGAAIDQAEAFFDEKFQKFIELPDQGQVLDLTYEDPRIKVIHQIKEVYNFIASKKEFSKLIPEVRLNISCSLPEAKIKNEIAGVEGRITIVGGYPKASGEIMFGVSDHTARLILTAKEFDNSINMVTNLRYKHDYVKKIQEKTDLSLYEFIRETQPDEIRTKEHSTMQWLIKESIKNTQQIPDIIWDKGSVGKEPIIRVFAKNSTEMINKMRQILEALS